MESATGCASFFTKTFLLQNKTSNFIFENKAHQLDTDSKTHILTSTFMTHPRTKTPNSNETLSGRTADHDIAHAFLRGNRSTQGGHPGNVWQRKTSSPHHRDSCLPRWHNKQPPRIHQLRPSQLHRALTILRGRRLYARVARTMRRRDARGPRYSWTRRPALPRTQPASSQSQSTYQQQKCQRLNDIPRLHTARELHTRVRPALGALHARAQANRMGLCLRCRPGTTLTSILLNYCHLEKYVITIYNPSPTPSLQTDVVVLALPRCEARSHVGGQPKPPTCKIT